MSRSNVWDAKRNNQLPTLSRRLWDTTKSLYFFLLLCSPICHGACFFSQASLEKMRVIGLRDGLPKKIAVLFYFVQMRGGPPCPNFCPLFTNCIYWVNLGMGRKGETPTQIFWHIGVQKNGTSCPN